jgi:hypothetical protein
MNRLSFIGVAVVAVLALSLTATAVDTGLPTGTYGLSGDGDENIQTDQQAAASSGTGGSEDGSSDGLSTDEMRETDSERPNSPALWQVGASILFLTVGGVLVLYGLTSGADVEPDPENTVESSDTSRLDSDRSRLVRDVPPTNEVYRTWQALRDSVCEDADSVSPAEVATAAVQDGRERQAVETLNSEFCAVRYGTAAPTEERERRARSAGATLGLRGVDN